MRIGPHPLLNKFKQKKNPIRGLLGMYNSFIFDGRYPACVKIFGADGNVIKIIRCRSNDHAKETAKQLNTELRAFLDSITSKLQK